MYTAILLAGGFGSRLHSISGGTPKPLMPIANVPFVYHIMTKLEREGCSKIILALHYGAEIFEKRLAVDNPVSVPVVQVIEPQPLGTGGAIKYASSWVDDDFVLILNADTYCDVNFMDFVTFSSEVGNSVVVTKRESSERYGSVLLTPDSTRVRGFREKQASGPSQINAGIYVFRKNEIGQWQEGAFSLERDYLPDMAQKGLSAYLHEGLFVDIGVPEDYLWADQNLRFLGD